MCLGGGGCEWRFVGAGMDTKGQGEGSGGGLVESGGEVGLGAGRMDRKGQGEGVGVRGGERRVFFFFFFFFWGGGGEGWTGRGRDRGKDKGQGRMGRQEKGVGFWGGEDGQEGTGRVVRCGGWVERGGRRRKEGEIVSGKEGKTGGRKKKRPIEVGTFFRNSWAYRG